MIKDTDFLRIFDVARRTDRDAEIPLLQDFLRDRFPVGSVLDVGSYGAEYILDMHHIAELMTCVDITHDPDVAHVADKFLVGNFNKLEIEKHDTVLCVSTLEHAGISTYKGSYTKERSAMFRKAVNLANKHVFISFPVGQKYIYPDELAIVEQSTFKTFLDFAEKNSSKVHVRFLYTQGAQAGHSWVEHNLSEVAFKIPYIDFIGNQSIAVMEIDK